MKNCKDCYYKGINKCFMYNKNYEEIENCTEYLTDPYEYNNRKNEDIDFYKKKVIGVKPKK